MLSTPLVMPPPNLPPPPGPRQQGQAWLGPGGTCWHLGTVRRGREKGRWKGGGVGGGSLSSMAPGREPVPLHQLELWFRGEGRPGEEPPWGPPSCALSIELHLVTPHRGQLFVTNLLWKTESPHCYCSLPCSPLIF